MKGFNLGYLFTGAGAEDWWKALGLGGRFVAILFIGLLLVLGVMNIWSFFVPKPSQNVNNPKALAIGHTIEAGAIDQRSTQIMVEEKKWSFEFGVGGFEYDNKLGVAGWGKITRKW